MLYFKIAILCFMLLSIMYLVGNYLCCILKFDLSLPKIYSVGFITILIIFQLIAYPISAYQGPFIITAITFSIIMFALLVLSLRYLIVKGRLFINTEIEKNNYLWIVLLLISIILQSFLSSYMYHDDDDDAYYITASAVTIETGDMGLEPMYITSGLDASMTTHVSHRTDTSTWEYFIAYLSLLFSIEPVIIAHTVLPLILIPLSYLINYYVASILIEKKKAIYFMLIFSLLNLFGAYAVYSPACFMLLRIWQGKAVLVSIIFPILLGNCLEIIKDEKFSKQYWIFNAMILLGGVCTTIIGVYLTPIYYMMIGIPFLLYIKWKEAKKIILPILLSLIPCLIFTIISFLQVVSTNSAYLTKAAPVWNDVFKMNLLSGHYIILFVLALIYTIWKGNITQKLFLVGTTALTFITFLNPLLCTFVAQKITGVDVYWRLYWIIPIYYGISFMLSDLLNKISNKIHIVLTLAVVTITLYNIGYFMYQEPFYYKHENLYKLPSEVIGTVDYIIDHRETESKPNVLFPEHLSAKVRQYSTEVVTMWSRYQNSYDNLIPNTDMELQAFYLPLYAGEIVDGNYIINNLKNMQVEWLVISNTTQIPQTNGINLETTIEGYNIYRIK